MGILTFKIVDGELEFANNTITVITGAEALKQRLKNRMLLWSGEWFLAPAVGIYWLDILEAKPPDLVQVKKELRDELLSDPAVTVVTEFTLDFDKLNRRLSIAWTVDGDLGLVSGNEEIGI